MERRSRGLKYVYGPVPSRRLGRSLGVDLVPFKTCTYDCVYCQLARTTDKTSTRRDYIPVATALAEIEKKLDTSDRPDFIALAGSGEPTLERNLGVLITGIRGLTDIPVAVITNGSLLWMEEVQEELLAADVVLPSLDAGDARMFERINRPHPAIVFDRMVEGLAAFTRRCAGRVWLEVMLVAGLNDTLEAVSKIAGLVQAIRPDRVQLNTVSRPSAEHPAGRVSTERMTQLSGLFSGEVEAICDFTTKASGHPFSDGATSDDILNLLGRRPCTISDIAAGLSLHELDVMKRLDPLLTEGRVAAVGMGNKTVYRLPAHENRHST